MESGNFFIFVIRGGGEIPPGWYRDNAGEVPGKKGSGRGKGTEWGWRSRGRMRGGEWVGNERGEEGRRVEAGRAGEMGGGGEGGNGECPAAGNGLIIE